MRAARSLQILKGSDLDAMRRACLLAAATLKKVGALVQPGVTTGSLDAFVHEYTLDHGAYPAPLNYPGPPTDPRRPRLVPGAFPRSVCTSVNEVICHGIPSSQRTLRDGDIVNIDVTSLLDGFYGDTSATFCVGEVSAEVQKLVDASRHCLGLGIQEVRPGGYVGDIGAAIQTYAEGMGYGVVRDYCGHGVGRVFHAEPQVAHAANRGQGERMVVGLCFTIEPMINEGSWRARPQADGWTVITADRKLSAQFEHTLVVAPGGCEVLTDPERIPGSEFDD